MGEYMVSFLAEEFLSEEVTSVVGIHNRVRPKARFRKGFLFWLKTEMKSFLKG